MTLYNTSKNIKYTAVQLKPSCLASERNSSFQFLNNIPGIPGFPLNPRIYISCMKNLARFFTDGLFLYIGYTSWYRWKKYEVTPHCPNMVHQAKVFVIWLITHYAANNKKITKTIVLMDRKLYLWRWCCVFVEKLKVKHEILSCQPIRYGCLP